MVEEAAVRLPLATSNRHGLIASAAGTGKTRTLQLLAEQLSAAGVPVDADVKGDLWDLPTGRARGPAEKEGSRAPGRRGSRGASRPSSCRSAGSARASPYAPRSRTSGPLLLAKILGRTRPRKAASRSSSATRTRRASRSSTSRTSGPSSPSSTRTRARPGSRGSGGVSSATIGVLLRSSSSSRTGRDGVLRRASARHRRSPARDLRRPRSHLVPRAARRAGQAEAVLDRPHVAPRRALRAAAGGRRRPKPKLVFFFDEAHLLFADATDAFLDSVVQTVRLIRSKGVGVFFITRRHRRTSPRTCLPSWATGFNTHSARSRRKTRRR